MKKNRLLFLFFVFILAFSLPVNADPSINMDNNNPPVTDFVISPEHPIIWCIINFTDISTDPDDDIIARMWNIDGHIHTTVVVQCAFLKPGNYSAILLVMDSKGNTDTIEKVVTIHDAPHNDISEDENETNIITPKNITLTFGVNDQNGNPLYDADIFIYDKNNLMVEHVVTNESGNASANVPPGYYKINVSYKNISNSRNTSFSSNTTVVFNLTIIDSTPPAGFNWWFVIIISIIIYIGFAKKKNKII